MDATGPVPITAANKLAFIDHKKKGGAERHRPFLFVNGKPFAKRVD